jgi:hypothetical protein
MRRAQVNSLHWSLSRSLAYSPAWPLSAGAAAPPPPATDPFLLYPSFNKNLFPPHTAAGFWGAQSAIVEPVLPSNLVAVTAANFAELDAHAQAATPASGRDILMTGDVLGSGNVIFADLTNVRVRVPVGRILTGVIFGSGPTSSNTVWVTGSTPGDPTTCGNYRNCAFGGTHSNSGLYGANWSGVIGTDAFTTFGDPNTLLFVINSRCSAASDGFLGDPADVCWIGSSILVGRGLDTNAQWAIRSQDAGRQIFFGCQIHARMFDPIRSHPRSIGGVAGTGTTLFWFNHCLLYMDATGAPPETKLIRVDSAFGGQNGVAPGVWIGDCDFFLAGPAGTPINIVSGTHVRIGNNRFRTTFGMTDSDIAISGATTQSLNDGGANVYSAFGAAPTWGMLGHGAGDPSGISFT